jgi:hypothetical protein
MDWTSIRDLLMPVVQALLMALVPIVVGLAVQMLRKAGLDLSAEQQAKMEATIGRIVAETEEWASAQAKAGKPVTTTNKILYFNQRVAEELPKLGADQATAIAQAILGRMKLQATIPFRT